MKTAAQVFRQVMGGVGSIFSYRSASVGLMPKGCFTFIDDFMWYIVTHAWAALVGDATTSATIGDTAGGVLALTTNAAADNAEVYMSTSKEVFLFQINKRVWFEARVKMTEAASHSGNIIIGLSDVGAANTLVDNGGGPVTTFDGAVFYKVDGGSTWGFCASNAASQDKEADVGDFTSGAWVTLAFEFAPDANGTTGTITPFVNGVAGTAVTITLSGLEEMKVMFGLKCGTTATETLYVDYVAVSQER